ncbi:DPP IV N-terminal domain-containing protein [Capnocytophaga leadbetteri]|uniref:S9 family peptidase n=1 Tax=Capnocytophaga leadbetteri TaxID=327575 RepID=UPI0028EBB581|nr:DPP IV N-terminal domain-containing protein [Capnocytophaga leadbetteri]
MKKLLSAALFSLLIFPFWAQNRPLSVAETIYYAVRDDSQPMGYRSLSPETLRYLQWVNGTQHYLYASDTAYEVFDVQGKKITSFGAAPYSSIEYIDKDEAVLALDNKYQRYNYHTQQTIAEISLPEGAANNDYDPKSKSIAYTLKNNLYIANEANSKIAITAFTDPNIVAGGVIHRNEFGIQKGTFFSPKGSLLAFYQKDESRVADYPLVDITTTPAALKAIKYPMAGQGSEQAAVGVYNLQTKKLIYLDIDTKDEHFLTNLAWSPDEKYLLLAEINREQNHFALNRYDATTGKKVNTIFEESNPKWVEPENPAVFLPNSNDEFLWLSERDGFMNVYHYSTNGKLIKQLTHFRWVVQDILGFDSKGENFFIVGTGADPREKQCLKINLKNPKKITALTTTPGTHKVQLSSDGKYLLDTYSSISIPKNIDLINTEKGSAKRLLTAANPLEGFAIGTPELLTLKADDGTTLYAKMHKPQNFDPQKKYPVLIYVYGGPHAQEVKNSWGVGSYLWLSAFAQNDQYIVFTLDNRGSENRGFAFESVIHRHLGDYEIKDQLAGVAYLKSLPYVDANRIAVHGWSFGGFMASSLLTRHPEVFRTAVAGGAVTDWKYYEVMYGERYMDTPQTNPEGYENSRVGKYLDGLKRPLLFIHGSVDDIVVPQHLMSLTKESISKNDFIEMFFYPMHAHGVSGLDHINLTERIIDYIKKHNQ